MKKTRGPSSYNYFKKDKHDQYFLTKNATEPLPQPAVKLFAGYDSTGRLRYDNSVEEDYCENCKKLFQICLHEGRGVCYKCYEKLTHPTTEAQNQHTKKYQRKRLLKPRQELLAEIGRY